MTPPFRSLSSVSVFKSFLAAFALAACANSEPSGDETGTAGTSGGTAGAVGSGGSTGGTGPGPGTAGTVGNGGSGNGAGSAGTAGSGSAGSSGFAGTTGTAGSIVTGTAGHGGSGGSVGNGGNGASTGGAGATGAAGNVGTAGSAGATGLAGRGGTTGSAGATGGAGRGGTTGSAGRGGTTGGGGGGATGTAGTTGTGGVTLDCNAALPSGGTAHTSSNASGTAAGMNWTIWTNGSAGTITTFSVPAFSASWNNSGDYLARLGLQWNATKTYDQLGTVTAQYASKKSGSGGGYSYIGIYGWSVSPCVEFYIVDDSFGTMPVNPGNTTNKGTVTIDGGEYILYTRNTSGTGGSKCPGVSSWLQFYSVRKTARACGQISITEHFKAWEAAGMALGKMDQAQILVEVGGGSGSVEFPMAIVTAQ